MALNSLSSDHPLGGRYQIAEKLGEGGFGQTFKAQDLHLPGHPICVVKQLKPQVEDAHALQVARRLFDTEAKVLYQLGSHPQIPDLLAHFEQASEFYLAQELIEGRGLAEEFANIPWHVSKVVDFLKDILETLAFVHENGVIHRDLKPSNLIRRQQNNRIVLIDFGAVKQVGTQPANSAIGQTISIGTHGYMPSEQLAGHPHYSSDVYAIGIMGIQALTGRLPQQLIPDATGEIDWHGSALQTPPPLRTVLDTMVRYDFRSRYVSAREALAALQSLGTFAPAPAPSQVSVETEPAPTAFTVPAMGQLPEVERAMDTQVAVPAEGPRLPIRALVLLSGVILGAGIPIGRALLVTPGDTPPAPPNIVTSQPVDQGIPLTAATAQTTITTFYNHLSNQAWEAAKAQTSGAITRQFDPNFFQQFQRVSVENLRVTAETPDRLELIGLNTYFYDDGTTQQEERTFTVERIENQPRIVDSAFIRVTKSR